MKYIAFGVLLLCVSILACAQPSRKDTGWIQHQDVRLYFERTGAGRPVLFIHGGFLDHNMWKPQLEVFTQQHQVITIDLPAHGLSSGSDSSHLMQDVLLTLLDSLHLPKVSLVGLSLGGACATDFVLAHPERVHKLILVSSLVTGYETKFPVDTLTNEYFSRLRTAINNKQYEEAAEVFTHYWCDGQRSAQQVDSGIRGYVYRTTLNTIIKGPGYSKWPQFARPYAIDRIHQITNPVLLIWGNKDLPTIQEAAANLGSLIPNCSKTLIPNVAHMVNLEASSEFNRVVLRFLQ